MKFYEEGDEVVAVRGGTDAEELIIATKNGLVLRTSNEEVRMVSRVAKGVKVVRLDEGDEVVAVACATPEDVEESDEGEEEKPATAEECKLDGKEDDTNNSA